MITQERAEQLKQLTGMSPGGDVSAPQKKLSPDERLAAFRNRRKKVTPSDQEGQSEQQAKQPAASSGGLSGFLEDAGRNIGQFGQGVAKGVMSLPQEAASLGSDIGMRAAAAIRPNATYEQIKAAQEGGEGIIGGLSKGIQTGEEATKEQFSPKTGPEKLGFGAEKIAEFFVPVGAAGKVATKGAEIAMGAEKALSFGEKALNLGRGAVKLGQKAATEGFEMGARTALQEGKADERSIVAAGIGGMMPILGKGLGLVKGQLPKLSKKLEEINLRLTPAQRRQFTDKIDEVTDYLAKNKVVGSAPKRLEKITTKYEAMEPQLDNFLKNTAKDRTISKDQILRELDALKSGYQDRVDSDVIESQIDRIADTIKRKQGDLVPVLNLNKLKRSAYDSAYNEGGNKVLDDVMHDVGDTLRKNIESATEGLSIGGKNIADFNKEYSTLINARKLLKAATSRKDIGFLSKLISAGIGHTIGSTLGPIGAAAGAAVAPGIAETMAGTFPRSAMAATLKGVSEASIPEGVKTATKGITSQILQK